MIVLYTESAESIDITEAVQVSEYVVSDSLYVSIIVEFSETSGSGGSYSTQVYIDDKLLCPDKNAQIATDVVNFRLQSKAVLVLAGSTIVVKVQGLVSDSNCDITVTIVNVTPVVASQVTDTIVPEIAGAVSDAVDNINITVKQETKLLGPCKTNEAQSLMPQPQMVTKPLLPKPCVQQLSALKQTVSKPILPRR